MIPAHKWCYDSPSPSRVLRPYYLTPPATRPFIGESPLVMSESASAKRKSTIVRSDDIFEFWKATLSTAQLDDAEKRKCLFPYEFDKNSPYKNKWGPKMAKMNFWTLKDKKRPRAGG